MGPVGAHGLHRAEAASQPAGSGRGACGGGRRAADSGRVAAAAGSSTQFGHHRNHNKKLKEVTNPNDLIFPSEKKPKGEKHINVF